MEKPGKKLTGFRVGRVVQSSACWGSSPRTWRKGAGRLAAYSPAKDCLAERPFQMQWGPDTLHYHKQKWKSFSLLNFYWDGCIWALSMAEGNRIGLFIFWQLKNLNLAVKFLFTSSWTQTGAFPKECWVTHQICGIMRQVYPTSDLWYYEASVPQIKSVVLWDKCTPHQICGTTSQVYLKAFAHTVRKSAD